MIVMSMEIGRVLNITELHSVSPHGAVSFHVEAEPTLRIGGADVVKVESGAGLPYVARSTVAISSATLPYFEQYYRSGRVDNTVKPSRETQYELARLTQLYVRGMSRVIVQIDDEMQAGRHEGRIIPEERELFRESAERLRAGDVFVSVKKRHFPVQKLVHQKFFERVSSEMKVGLAARNIQASLGERFAMKQARIRYLKLPEYLRVESGVALDDLRAAANIALLRAAEKYDPARGTSFLTYANHWIQQIISLEIDAQLYGQSVPYQLKLIAPDYFRARFMLTQRNESEPSAGEIADYLGIEVKLIHEMILCLSREVRLSTPLRDRKGEQSKSRTVADVLSVESHEQEYINAFDYDENLLQEALAELPDDLIGRGDRARFLDLVYCFFMIPRTAGGEVMGVSDLARKYGVSKQAIDQSMKKCLRRVIAYLEDSFILPEGTTYEMMAMERSRILGKGWMKTGKINVDPPIESAKEA